MYRDLGTHEKADGICDKRIKVYKPFGLIRVQEVKREKKKGTTKICYRKAPGSALSELDESQIKAFNQVIKTNKIDLRNICARWPNVQGKS